MTNLPEDYREPIEAESIEGLRKNYQRTHGTIRGFGNFLDSYYGCEPDDVEDRD